MTQSDSDRMVPNAVLQRAAAWMARLWADDASDAERAECLRWRSAHPDHENAWRQLHVMEDTLHRVPKTFARASWLSSPPASFGRRRILAWLGGGFITAAAGLAALDSDRGKGLFADFSSATGEIRRLVMEDGTVVILNTLSAINVRFSGAERRIVLLCGEIMVATADESRPTRRPVRVQSRHGMVQGVHSRFSVALHGDSTHVTVFDGAVDLQPRDASLARRRLDRGARADISETVFRPISPATDADGSWSEGLVIAERMQVGEFVALIARYRHGLVQCDPSIRNLEVTGIYSLRDTQRTLATLAGVLPIKVTYRSPYWVIVQAA
jgi:transmembrane sensor